MVMGNLFQRSLAILMITRSATISSSRLSLALTRQDAGADVGEIPLQVLIIVGKAVVGERTLRLVLLKLVGGAGGDLSGKVLEQD